MSTVERNEAPTRAAPDNRPSTDAPGVDGPGTESPDADAPMAPVPDAGGYLAVRSVTELLAKPLGPEDQVVQSMTEASPTKWHRAHTTWFFEEFVLAGLLGRERFDPDFRYLFNSYYEAVGPRQPRPRRGMVTRPAVERVADYRRHVDAAMADVLESGALESGAPESGAPESGATESGATGTGTGEAGGAAPGLCLVELGLHHEQQHQELLLMDAKHLLWQNPLLPTYSPADQPADPLGEASAPAPVRPDHGRRRTDTPAPGSDRAELLEHDGGLVELGHRTGPQGTAGFAFDNEGPRHRQWLEPFALEDRLVTCGEWLAFMDDGGYERPELWLSDGWHRGREEHWDAPLYWMRIEGDWHHFTLHGPVRVDPHEPVVHVSYHEADAYARWAGARLPTEAEWEVVARDHWSPPGRGSCPALHPSAAGAAGADPHQFTGEAWQWTSSAYLPYPRFSPTAGAVGEYNGKFMVDQHVLRGGACVTPPGHERVTYRNFFPTASRWAFAGVRLAHG